MTLTALNVNHHHLYGTGWRVCRLCGSESNRRYLPLPAIAADARISEELKQVRLFNVYVTNKIGSFPLSKFKISRSRSMLSEISWQYDYVVLLHSVKGTPFGPNCLCGRCSEVTTSGRQSLLHRSLPLPPGQKIPGSRQNSRLRAFQSSSAC